MPKSVSEELSNKLISLHKVAESVIDRELGEGFARSNPVILSGYVQALSAMWSAMYQHKAAIQRREDEALLADAFGHRRIPKLRRTANQGTGLD